MVPEALSVAMTHQFAALFLLGLPVACVSWTMTHEELLREPREYCKGQAERCKPVLVRKFFYLFTCEYCFSHYVALFFLWVTRFTLLYQGWRGYLVAGFALVWVANVYMSVFNRLRLEIKHENVQIATAQVVKEKVEAKNESQLVQL
jgi:hypothetical protein